MSGYHINSQASLGHGEEGEFLRVLEHTAYMQGLQEDDVEEVKAVEVQVTIPTERRGRIVLSVSFVFSSSSCT